MNLDLQVFSFIHGFAGQYFVLDWVFIFFAKYLPYLVCLVLFFSWLRTKNAKRRLFDAVFFGLALLLARGLFVEVIRYIVPRERPFAALGFEPLIAGLASHSLPSGHASFFFALAFAAFYLGAYSWGRLLIIAVFVSLARIYVGVHYPLDIIAGAIVGFLSAFLVSKLLSKSLFDLQSKSHEESSLKSVDATVN